MEINEFTKVVDGVTNVKWALNSSNDYSFNSIDPTLRLISMEGRRIAVGKICYWSKKELFYIINSFILSYN